MTLSDQDLIIGFLNGNESRFEELVFRYDKKVLSLAVKYADDEDDAKDIYQEVFIRVYKGLKKFKFQSEFSTWLFRITTNVCLTYRSGKKRIFMQANDNWEEGSQDTYVLEAERNESMPDRIFASTEIRENVERALEKLTPKQKICFLLKHFEGYKIKEIAGMLDCKEGTVKKYLFESIQKLKIYLNTIYETGVI